MKTLLLILTFILGTSFAGEIVKIRGNKLVFRMDKHERTPKLGDVYIIERDGIEIGRVKYLKSKAHLGAGRVISGVAKKGDMAIQKKTEDLAIISDADEDLMALKGEIIEDETSFEVAAPMRSSEQETSMFKREQVSENNMAIALIGGATSTNKITHEFDGIEVFDFKETKNNALGATFSYKLNRDLIFNAEYIGGTGTAQICIADEIIERTAGTADAVIADCNQMDTKMSNINFGVDYFLTRNLYLGLNVGVLNLTYKDRDPNGGSIEMSGGSASAKLGLHFDISQNIFFQFEGRYQTTNFNSVDYAGGANSNSYNELKPKVKDSVQTASALASLGVAF